MECRPGPRSFRRRSLRSSRFVSTPWPMAAALSAGDLVTGHRGYASPRLVGTPGWTGVLATCMLTGLAAPTRAQTVSPTERSTLSGVYRTDQAEAGRDFYAGRCRSCHTPGGHVLTFKAKWAGRPLSEAFEYISQEMPKDSPGSLSPEETTLV